MTSKLGESCLNEPKIRRHIILYEFRSGLPIFECYKHFCARMGPDSLDFLEFEFWWMRFSAGNFDLDYDRSQDPKYRTISDMPVHIFEKICEKLGDNYQTKYRFTLRHVCKSFRALADSWIPICKKLSISSPPNGNMSLNFDWESFQYQDEQLALDDLISILKHPKLKLERFHFRDIRRFLGELLLKLESLKIKIHIENAHWSQSNWECQKRFFPFYRAETVQMVYIEGTQEKTMKFINEIGEIEPEERILFSRMEITLRYLYIKDATKIIKNFLKLSNLKYCHLKADLRTTVQLKINIERFGAKNQFDRPDVFHYPIANSNDYFEIEVQRNGIRIERKSVEA
ncbi:hypothetical protein B9Z55_029149 [Caenorhabditis nigoni]|uniref:Mos1 transposase HTH domain-containing protein n=2 Tax=Caenorhabditis nigoni TaxID=1611254 RepID=A0A2G5S8T3_9PELO|nr:hypothetical protein B9Z55_029149 [Caenorhabditis nigoni]